MPAQHHILDAFGDNSGLLERLGAALEGIVATFLGALWASGQLLGARSSFGNLCGSFVVHVRFMLGPCWIHVRNMFSLC